MSAPGGAPSPAPRSGSMGPSGGMPMPPQQPMAPNPPVTGGAPGPTPPSNPAMSQQNLNQIVSELFVFCCFAPLCLHKFLCPSLFIYFLFGSSEVLYFGFSSSPLLLFIKCSLGVGRVGFCFSARLASYHLTGDYLRSFKGREKGPLQLQQLFLSCM